MTTQSTLFKILAAGVLALGCASSFASPKIVKKVPPEFPAEAARQSVSSGTVRAKMTIDGTGKVTAVEIIEAQPRRVFDKAVTNALLDWRFEGTGAEQTHEVKLVFRNDE